MPYDANVIGWMNKCDLETIEMLAGRVPEHGTIVEIGSMFGKSSVCWAMSCSSTVQIHCIDTFNNNHVPEHSWSDELADQLHFPKAGVIYDMYQLFQENTKRFPNVHQIQAWAPNVTWDAEIDLFFLDANHKNPNDWNILCKFVPLIKPGGILCGHDYSTSFSDVIDNVRRLEKLLDKEVTLYKQPSSMWSFVIDKKIVLEPLETDDSTSST